MINLKINPFVKNLKESATLAINLKAKAMRKEGHKVYHWGFGESPFPVPKEIQNALKENTDKKEYLPTNGLVQLRDSIKIFYNKEYNLKFNIDQIFIGPGSKELIFQLIYLLESEYLIPSPSWVSYGPQVHLKGIKPFFLETTLENNYKISPQELESYLEKNQSNTQCLILNSPSNPTGQVYSTNELKELSQVLKKYQAIVISDEIYSQVNFENTNSPSLASYYPEGTIITGGLSKAHSAGGYRLGYMIIPNELSQIIKPLKSMISETFSAVSTPIQYAATCAWQENSNIQRVLSIYKEIHKKVGLYFWERLHSMKIKCPKPEGGFYLFVSFEEYSKNLQKIGIKNSEELCSYLLDKYSIALLPGEDFYFKGEKLCARLAFVDYNGEEVISKLEDESLENPNFIPKFIPHLKDGLDQLENFIQDISKN